MVRGCEDRKFVYYSTYMETVSYDEFKKMDIRIGTIREIVPVEGADKLLKCMVEIGDKSEVSAEVSPTENPEVESAPQTPILRQIVSGIREYFPDYEKLIGKQVLYIVNLEPRTIRGVESRGMLMAVDGIDGKPVFLVPDVPVAPGSKVR